MTTTTLTLKRERNPSRRPANPAMAAALKRLKQEQAQAQGKTAAPPRLRFPRAELTPARKRVREILPRGEDGKVLPLAVGVADAVVKLLGIDPAMATLLLHEVSGETSYLEAVAKGDSRHDLDGKPVEEIKPAHRTFAWGRLYEREAWVRREKRKAREGRK